MRTYGCQMNAHDSERISGLLEQAGYVRADAGGPADVVVFNTCAVRENADNRLYGNLGHLRPVKDAHPGMQIAVGGCLAQKDRGEIVRQAPWVDVVFGTHNIGSLPVLLERARHNAERRGGDPRVARGLPVHAADPARVDLRRLGVDLGRLQQHLHVLHRARRCAARRRTAARATCWPRCEALVAEGVLEVTLLGQNVNSYGVEFGDRLRVRQAAARLRRARGRGLERVRFTSPHPKDFTDDVIAAMAETPNVCHSLHMPLQSGSDAVLKAMRRSYRAERYLGIIDEVRAAMPDAAITTDIIVGFPGETEADFQSTLDVVRAARFSSAFTFQYSKRPGTPAATMDGQVPKEVVQERYDRLIACSRRSPGRRTSGSSAPLWRFWSRSARAARTAPPAGCRAAPATAAWSTSAAGPTADAGADRPGDIVHATVTYAAPHHLNADGPLVAHRRTRAGDAWEPAAWPARPA